MKPRLLALSGLGRRPILNLREVRTVGYRMRSIFLSVNGAIHSSLGQTPQGADTKISRAPKARCELLSGNR